jgi:hypothetical protein
MSLEWQGSQRTTINSSFAVEVNVGSVGVELVPAQGNNAIITNMLDMFTVRKKKPVVHPRYFIYASKIICLFSKHHLKAMI